MTRENLRLYRLRSARWSHKEEPHLPVLPLNRRPAPDDEVHLTSSRYIFQTCLTRLIKQTSSLISFASSSHCNLFLPEVSTNFFARETAAKISVRPPTLPKNMSIMSIVFRHRSQRRRNPQRHKPTVPIAEAVSNRQVSSGIFSTLLIIIPPPREKKDDIHQKNSCRLPDHIIRNPSAETVSVLSSAENGG